MVRELDGFVQQICSEWSKPQVKLARQVVEGIVKAESVRLSQIGRQTMESGSLESTEKRLSRMLGHSAIDIDAAWVSYWKRIAGYLTKETVLAVDFGDITKTYSEHQAHLGHVYDGSKGGVATGWMMLSIEALLSRRWGYRRHVPVYTELFSAQAPGFSSQNDVVQIALTRWVKAVGTKGLWTFDEGFDALWLFRVLDGLELSWVIRAGGERRVWLDETSSTTKLLGVLAEEVKLSISFPHPGKKHAGELVHVGHRSVFLGQERRRYTLLVVHGLGQRPFRLLSNQIVQSTADAIRLVRGYLLRWAVEEEFRLLKKGMFKLEDIRVRLWTSLQRLVVLAVWAYGFLAGVALSLRRILQKILDASPHFRNPARFIYYRLCHGVAALLTS
jgi:hypothetical protein